MEKITRPEARSLAVVPPDLVTADAVLHDLIDLGEVIERDGQRYLVVPVSEDMIERIVIASAITEDLADDDPIEEDDAPGGNVEDHGEAGTWASNQGGYLGSYAHEDDLEPERYL